MRSRRVSGVIGAAVASARSGAASAGRPVRDPDGSGRAPALCKDVQSLVRLDGGCLACDADCGVACRGRQ